jgi:hypothetical protein
MNEKKCAVKYDNPTTEMVLKLGLLGLEQDSILYSVRLSWQRTINNS